MSEPINLRSLLDAAVHFGHQTRRWNPKMKPYILGERNGIYILDLKQTLYSLDRAYTFVSDLAARGKTILFVGTKKQAQEAISQQAERCGMPYVNNRWLGGMLTNFVTIRDRVGRMEELELMETDGRMDDHPKKEQIILRKELGKLQANLNGIRAMHSIPQAIFVVDTHREDIAIREARRLGIPVVGIIDTNSDPDDVDYGIPGNDDAIRSVALLTEVIASAVVAGSTGGAISESDMEAPTAEGAAAEAAATVAVAEAAVAEAVVAEVALTEAVETVAVAEAVAEAAIEAVAGAESVEEVAQAAAVAEAAIEAAEVAQEVEAAVEVVAAAAAEAAEEAVAEAAESVAEADEGNFSQ